MPTARIHITFPVSSEYCKGYNTFYSLVKYPQELNLGCVMPTNWV